MGSGNQDGAKLKNSMGPESNRMGQNKIRAEKEQNGTRNNTKYGQERTTWDYENQDGTGTNKCAVQCGATQIETSNVAVL